MFIPSQCEVNGKLISDMKSNHQISMGVLLALARPVSDLMQPKTWPNP